MARNSSTSPEQREQRAQLLRELSQDLNRTRNSSASTRFSQGTISRDNTSSSFDPENEALVSTRQIDNSPQKLPELRASAQKYNRFGQQPQSELDYAIDTSALGRAFPDFTQGGSSSDDGSVSIEIGRGLKKGSGTAIGKLGGTTRSPATSNRDDSFDFSAPMVGNHRVTSTPPLMNPKTRKNNAAVQSTPVGDSQVRKASGLRNEIREPTPPLTKTKDYGSGSSRQGSENRQSLAALHARVRDENDTSYIDEDRAPTIDLTSRSSRFTSGKHQNREQHQALPGKFSSKQNFTQSTPQDDATATAKQRLNAKGLPTSNHGTQSIVLPDMPNVSELVSGVFEDGTPVFSLNGKARSSRFVSGSRTQRRLASRPTHSAIDEIDVPEDEQDIYLSLQLLQDKVDQLERNRGEAEVAIGELQERNRVLEAEKSGQQRRQRSDSAIGLTDGSDAGDEMNGRQRKLLIEKNRLESSVRTLSTQVESTARKLAVSDTTLRNVTKERDSAVSQLAVAYFTIEQLKTENARLTDENCKLKAKLGPTIDDSQVDNAREARKENRAGHANRRLESELRTYEDANASRDKRPVDTLEDTHNRQRKRSTKADSVRIQFKDQVAAHKSGNSPSKKQTGNNSSVSAHHDNSRQFRHSQNHVTDLFPPAEQTRHSVDYAESESSQGSEIERFDQSPSRNKIQQSREQCDDQTRDATRDLTYLSFLEVMKALTEKRLSIQSGADQYAQSDDIANLRRTLEYERFERKQQQASNGQAAKSRENTIRTDADDQLQQLKLPRKPSLKTTTRQATDPADTTSRSLANKSEAAPSHKVPSEHARRHSETSVDAKRQQRHGGLADNMTSAFILPDISIREFAPELLAAGEKVLDDLKNHDGQNCTVCHQTVRTGSSHDHTSAAKATITIPKPIPVSERMPEPTPYNEEPTIRPSQPPAHALACVLKGLEDELAHQKIKLAHYQKLYSGHDPALSKRQRKSVCAKIETLVRVIDVKADQIYSLYDVLEGQKQDGHEMTEKEVEVTLQSIGVEGAELGLRGGALGDDVLPRKSAERQPWDLDSNEGSDEGLPWEGIESTTGTGGESRRRS